MIARLNDSDQRLQTLEALQTSNASVIARASKAQKVAPRPLRAVLLGILAGLILGVALAFTRDALDTRTRSVDEIVQGLGVPLLAAIGRPELRGADSTFALAMIDSPSSVDAEAFRQLRTNVDLARLTSGARVIVVTSAVEQEGKSTTLANLAAAYARAGQRVILLDCDLRRPSMDRYLRLRRSPGLTDVALGRHEADEVCQAVPIGVEHGNEVAEPLHGAEGELRVMTTGALPPDPSEFLSSDRFGAIVREARERYDMVLVDAPPILPVSDAVR